MKILFLGGNLVSDLGDWLRSQGEEVVYREDKISIEEAKEINPDFVISYNYKYIIPKEIIDYVRGKAVNLHISFLPYNRGYHPNVWSFLENTPKGVTIHYIDEGIDTGDIIIQKEVYIDENKETLKSSYGILHREIQALFKEHWDKIKKGKLMPQPQTGGGAYTSSENLVCLNHLSEKRDGIQQSENLKSNITEADVTIRNLEADDINNLFSWRNHPDIRKNFFDTTPVSWETHEKWFREKNNDIGSAIYMVYYRANKIGSVRFESKENTIKTSVILNPDYIGKGLGAEIIRIGTDRFIKEKSPANPIIAEIKKENIQSIKAFQKAGFKESYVTYVFPY